MMTILKQDSLEIQVSGPEGRDCADSCIYLEGPNEFNKPFYCNLYELNQNYTFEGTPTAFRCGRCINKFGLVKE